jgi:hypothetical protein
VLNTIYKSVGLLTAITTNTARLNLPAYFSAVGLENSKPEERQIEKIMLKGTESRSYHRRKILYTEERCRYQGT